jgi:hypothetical protein
MRQAQNIVQRNLAQYANIPSDSFSTNNPGCFFTSAMCDRTIRDYTESDEHRTNGCGYYLNLLSHIDDDMRCMKTTFSNSTLVCESFESTGWKLSFMGDHKSALHYNHL